MEDGVGQRRIGVFGAVEVLDEVVSGEVRPSYCEFGLLDGERAPIGLNAGYIFRLKR